MNKYMHSGDSVPERPGDEDTAAEMERLGHVAEEHGAEENEEETKADESQSEKEPGDNGDGEGRQPEDPEEPKEPEEQAESGEQDGQKEENDGQDDDGQEDEGQQDDVQEDEGQEDNGAQGEDKKDSRGQGNGKDDAEISRELGTEDGEDGQGQERGGFWRFLFGTDEEEDDGDQEEGQGKEKEEGKEGGKEEEQGGKRHAGKEKSRSPEEPEQGKRSGGKEMRKAGGDDGQDGVNEQENGQELSDSLEEAIAYWQGNDKIDTSLTVTKETLGQVMGLGSSFDVVFREMSFAGHKAALLFISGFAKDVILDEILKRLTYLTPENVSADVLADFMTEYIPHIQVEKGELLSEAVNKVLTGMSALFLEGEQRVILMDTRAYPSRSPDEPTIERVVRGSRDGFTETLLSNVSLVRRRLRDPGLVYEMHQIGRRTRTDVCVAYIDDIADSTMVEQVTKKLKAVDLDGIPLADKQLEEALVDAGWNPYPLVRYSERPDVVASHLLEGRVVVFVDTSPSVMILPTTFFDLCQHAEENRQTPFMGSYLRWVRFAGIFASMFLLPLWMLLVLNPELKPAMLAFIGPQETAKIPLLAQFLIVEIGVDLLRMAAVHTPNPLGSAMGLIAAILVGDIAVKTGLFVNEVVLYMAVAAIGMFATPSYELGLANRIVRLVLLLAVAAFHVPGFVVGSTLLVVLLATQRSYNSPYLWPFIPFNAKALGEIIVRRPVLSSKMRPSFNKTKDNTRIPDSHTRKKRK